MPPARKSKDKEYASARRRRSEQEAAARAPAEDRDAAREAAAARRSAALALAAERCGETVPGRETAPSRALVAPQNAVARPSEAGGPGLVAAGALDAPGGGYAPLHWACVNDLPDAAATLAARGADAGARSHPDGETPLIKACRYGHGACALALLEHAPGLDLDAAGADGATALVHAARFGCCESVDALVGRGADVRAADGDGRTALGYATRGGTCAAPTPSPWPALPPPPPATPPRTTERRPRGAGRRHRRRPLPLSFPMARPDAAPPPAPPRPPRADLD
ncbi:hypothetical protein JL720_4062 [Aureococcus anophagefferens]|nr:hypothetical protein JL720_4062 [Aureococcus anophagefferens]